MYLKKLILKGFKSFPHKIELDFKKGITGVVGPNGSGKSNISDAIRWVIGEQNAKSLRGDKMADIIFAGTESRKRQNFAEVSIIMDNEDRKLNIDYNEVKVTRYVSLTGESEFRINETKCNLKDIHNLFMDTGIGKEGYSIIGQGKIDAILTTKSDERRLLFEEAAGIVGFKKRKAEAERDLVETEENLVRVNDNIANLESRIEPLKIQSEKAKVFVDLKGKQKIVEVNMFIREYDNAKSGKNEIDNEIAVINGHIEDIKKQSENKTHELEKIKDDTIANENALSDCNEKKWEEETRQTTCKNNIEHLERENIVAHREIERITKEINKKYENIEFFNRKINENKLKKISLTNQLSIEKENLNNANAELEKIRKEFDLNNSNFEENYDELIIELMNKKTDVTTELGQKSFLKEQEEEKRKLLGSNITGYKVKINQSDVAINAAEVLLDKMKKECSLKYEGTDRIKIKVDELRSNVEQIKEKSNALKVEMSVTEKNAAMLENQAKAYNGYNKGAANVLKNRDNLSGIVGAVAEIIDVPEKYETAIQTALGAAAQNIVVEDVDAAKNTLKFLERTNGGRAICLPITVIKGRDGINASVLSEKGIIDTAENIISYDKKYSNVISNLLGKVVVAENIDDAAAAAEKYKYSFKIVTLNGQTINAGGSFAGGSVYKADTAIFSRERELKEAAGKKAELKKRFSEIENERIQAEKELLDMEEKSSEMIVKKEELLLKISKSESEYNNLKEQNNKMKEDYSKSLEDFEKTKDMITEIVSEISLLEQNIYNIENEIEDITEKKNIYQSEQKEKRKAQIDVLEIIRKISLEVNNIENEIKSIDTDNENNEKRKAELKYEIEQDKKTIEEKTKDKEKNIAKIKSNKEEIEVLNMSIVKLSEKYNILEAEKNRFKELFGKLNDDILELTKDEGRLLNDKTNLEARKIRIEENLEKRNAQMWEDYGITYASAMAEERLEEDDSELKNIYDSLKREINSLGNINTGAIEEYKQVKEDYDTKMAQRDDILNAMEDIRHIIENLIVDMERIFSENFQIINKNFSKMFSRMFNGGTAWLKFEDEENILASGIEISAQPPGKALQRISLLSGGEKTLTALSLLFAILVMKPSPFCVLDETDAALDDENVNRYADFLEQFAKDEQFIVITHRQGTMRIADTLYGITQNDGVSSVLSLSLEQAEYMDEFNEGNL